ncbi:hypothetical protein ACG7TL_008581 [Trametes sanguinea]
MDPTLASVMAAVVTEQGVNHPTFKSPPSDLDLSIPGLYEYHAKNSPNHAVFSYVNTATQAIRDITFAEAWDRINTLIERVYLDYKGSPQNSVSRFDHSRPVIGILAIADQLSYLYLEVAIMSLGYTVFSISSRNSAQVVAHLVEKTAIRLLYVSADPEMQALANSADKILRERNWQVWMRNMVTPKEYEKEHVPTEANRKVDIGDDDVTMILHSSGTTAFPKPIPVTRRRMINISKIPSFGEVDLAGKRIAAHTNPIYLAVSPPIIPTPSNFIASWIAGKCDIVFSVPVFIEAWARNPAHIPALSSLDCIVSVLTNAGPAADDDTRSTGAHRTEQGPATMFIPKDPPPIDEWEYFKLMPQATYHLEPQPGLKNIYEPIMIANDICAPNVTNMEMNGKPAYAVGDLLEQHPTNPDRWRVYGRKDVQIMLSTGENVNPVPIEEILGEDPHIVVAVMFGRHRIQPGVLIQPTPDHQIPTGDEKKAEHVSQGVILLVRQSVEKANAHSPAYARIERNMIIVASPDKPLDRTPKGSARHKVCVERYAEEIEKLYAIEEDCELHPELRQFPDRVVRTKTLCTAKMFIMLCLTDAELKESERLRPGQGYGSSYGGPPGGGYGGGGGYGAPPGYGGGPGPGGFAPAPAGPPPEKALINGDWSRLWKYIKDWQNVFRHFDRDQSGSIDNRELADALRQFGYNLSPQLLQLVERKYGPDANGITFDRFVRACVVIKQVTEAFQRLDTDRDGWVQINYDQFMHTVLSLP